MNKIERMNQYVANLAVMNVKLHNLHWNVKGIEFMAIHTFTEDIYNDLFIKYDDVAELIKMKGHQPLASMKSYLAVATIKESEQDSFSVKEVVSITLSDLQAIKNEAVDIREQADQEGDFEAVALFEDHISALDKNIWFLQNMAG